MLLPPALLLRSAAVLPFATLESLRSPEMILKEIEPSPWLAKVDFFQPAIFHSDELADFWSLVGGSKGVMRVRRNAALLAQLAESAGATPKELSYLSMRRRRLTLSALIALASRASGADQTGAAGRRGVIISYAEIYLRVNTILEQYDISTAGRLDALLLAG